jgi:hypothetical protein
VTEFSVSTRLVYFMNEVVGAVSNFYLTGEFNDCLNCSLEFGTGDANLIWRSGWGTPPADFPAFACDATDGELFEVCTIYVQIDCSVATESQTWSNVKSLFNN